MLLDPRNGPAFDLPTPHSPRRTYVIASTPRTGSTLLARALWDTGLVGAPKEYLNPMQIRDLGGTPGPHVDPAPASPGPAWSHDRARGTAAGSTMSGSRTTSIACEAGAPGLRAGLA